MNAQEFLTNIPEAPDALLAHPSKITVQEFHDEIGDVLYAQGVHEDYSGRDHYVGGSSHYYSIPTSNGWKVYYQENPGIILSATSPIGEKWKTTIIDLPDGNSHTFWCREEEIKHFNVELKEAMEKREDYLFGISDKIPTKYPQYFVLESWVCHEDYIYPNDSPDEENEHVRLYRVFNDLKIGEYHSSDATFEASWWQKGITLYDLF